MSAIRIAGLRCYPVKSLAGHDVECAEVESIGLAGDRRWMVVDAQGRFLTQRAWPAMARIQVQWNPTGLLLRMEGFEDLQVCRPAAGGAEIPVTVWTSTVSAVLANDETASWLSRALGTEARLCYLADPGVRTVDPHYGRPDDRVSFADGFPVLLAGTESLDDLNRRLAHPIAMTRFRPNIVVEGADAWAEDSWRRVRIGKVEFRIVKPCARCIVTTIDQDTGRSPVPKEPLKTLATFRRAEGGVMFGQNLIPDGSGLIRLGDRLHVLEAGLSNLTHGEGTANRQMS